MALTADAISQEWYDPTQYMSSPDIGFSAVYITPMEDYSNIYQYGYGMLIDLSYSSSGVSNWEYSFKIGAIRMIPKTETDEGYKTGFGSGYIFPLLGNVEYRYKIPFWKRIRIAPALSAGMAIITVTYDDRSGTIEGGVPTGRPAETDSRHASADPFALCGVNILYLVNITDSIFIRTDAGMIYESENPMYFTSVNAGYEKRF